jgi:hypothetical protein
MTNCLIFGTGRSGTTALAGALRASGAFAGEQFLPPTSQMPHGYVEDIRVNQWNNQILSQVCDYQGIFRAPVDVGLDFSQATPPDPKGMAELLQRQPYAIKDPRFSFTLPVWKPFLAPNTVCLVLFRDPVGFTASAVRLKKDWDCITDNTAALRLEWSNTYQHILAHEDETFIYIRYNDVLNGSVFPFLEEILGYKIDRTFIKPELAHAEQSCPEVLMPLYAKLLRRMVRPAGIPPATSGSEDRRSNN